MIGERNSPSGGNTIHNPVREPPSQFLQEPAMSDPIEVEIAGRKLRCSHCESGVFFRMNEIVQSGPERVLSFGHQRMSVYTCSRCGLRHSFSPDVERPETNQVAEADERVKCLSCGSEMPSDADACPNCGWSWDATEGEPDQST
jgi:DNA-directed RNA polymerase subunit RPC12/RpoP